MNAYQYGVIAGILVGLLVALISWKLARKKQGGKCQYDERQVAGQGKAYKAGFYTLMIAQTLCALGGVAELLPGSFFLWQSGVILLGIGVFAVTAIHFDAYVGMNEKPSRYYTMGSFFFMAMLCFGLGNILSDSPFRREIAVLNLMIAALWLVVIAALMIHQHRREDAE